MQTGLDAIRGCADLAYGLAERARCEHITPEALLLLADTLNEIAELKDGSHVERWIECYTDEEGEEIERTEIPS